MLAGVTAASSRRVLGALRRHRQLEAEWQLATDRGAAELTPLQRDLALATTLDLESARIELGAVVDGAPAPAARPDGISPELFEQARQVADGVVARFVVGPDDRVRTEEWPR